jgi:hypothetical protein
MSFMLNEWGLNWIYTGFILDLNRIMLRLVIFAEGMGFELDCNWITTGLKPDYV